MRLLEQLLGHLTKVVDEPDRGVAFQGIGDVVDVHRAFVKKVVENVVGVQSGLSLLLVAEDEVDPLVKVTGDVVAFKSLGLHNRKKTNQPFSNDGNIALKRIYSFSSSCQDLFMRNGHITMICLPHGEHE